QAPAREGTSRSAAAAPAGASRDTCRPRGGQAYDDRQDASVGGSRGLKLSRPPARQSAASRNPRRTHARTLMIAAAALLLAPAPPVAGLYQAQQMEVGAAPELQKHG